MSQRKTASKIGLAEECLFFLNPLADWELTSSRAADRGTRFHVAIDNYIKGTPLLAIDEDIREEYARACAWVDALRVKFPNGLFRSELMFAWNPETDAAECFDDRGPREYDDDGRIWGTADMLVVPDRDFPETVMVYDWGTGDVSGKGPQLRCLALMASRVYGVDHATVAALEVRADGVREVFFGDDLDSLTLASIAGELADIVAGIPSAQPKPGPHCGERYCPARTSCPAMHAAQAELVPEGALARKFSTAIESAEHAVWMLDRIKLVTTACDAIKDAIKAAVPSTGWALSDGGLLKNTTRQVERFDQFKATALCKQLGATDEQLASLKVAKEEPAGLRVVGGPKASKAKRGKAA